MTLAFRPLLVIALICFASGSYAAKKKAAPAVPSAPAACTDFYGHVNFDWLRNHPLPAGAPSFSRWDELNAQAQRQTAELLAGRMPAAGPASRLLGDLAASVVEPASLDAAALATARPLLAQVDAMRKAKDIPRVVAALHAAGVPVLFGFDALRSAENGQPRATFYPGGIGLPDPAYYSSSEPEIQRALSFYQIYLGELLKLAGVDAKKLAEQTGAAMAMEKMLAETISLMPSGGAPVSIAQAQKSYPTLLLADFMQAQGYAPALIDIRQPAFFQALDRQLVKPSLAKWQAYLRTQVMHAVVPAMGRDLRQPYLAALGLSAPAPSVLPAVERLANLTGGDAAELLSAAYAETYSSPAQLQRARGIAEAVRAAMGSALDRATWLSNEGKAAARSKLAAMQLSIGQPIEPISFDGLAFDRANFAGNILALRRWNRARSLARLSSAVWPWPISQAQPLIGYQSAENRLIVTASALAPPALEGSSAAAGHGSFGALVGQQMSLGFADFRESDGRGLAARQAGLVAQFSAYPAGETAKVNGLRTQRQNAADLAGVEIAWEALNALGPVEPAASKEFFHAWAATWARQDSPAALADSQAGSVFAPARWRVNGPLSNLPAFAKVYGCKAGQPMFRAAKDQLAIWR